MNALSMRDMIGAIFKSAHQKRRNGERGNVAMGISVTGSVKNKPLEQPNHEKDLG